MNTKTTFQSVSEPRYLHQVLIQINKYYIDTPVALLLIILIVKITKMRILMILIMPMIVILLMITDCWDNQVYRRPSRGGAYHHSLALQFPSFVQVPQFLQSNDSYNHQTTLNQNAYKLLVRRGVRSDAQLSCTETRFQKFLNTQCYQYLWLTM